MDIEELKRQRLAHLNKARDIVDSAEKESRDLTDEERESYDDCNKQADGIEARIKREEELNRKHGVFASPGPATGRPMPTPFIGMSDGEANRYSLLRAIRAAATGDWQEAGLEREASAAVAKHVGVEPRGFYVPYEWMERRQPLTPEQRDLLKGTPSAGGYTVATDLLGASFIDRLTNRMVMAQAGVTMLNGLVGDVAIARLGGGATAYWVAENGAPTESEGTFEQITLSPKTLAAFVDISRRLIQQSSVDVENLVQNDVAKTLGLGYDLAILQGTGSSNQPTGVRYQSGVTDKSGANGNTLKGGGTGTPGTDEVLALLEMIELESTVATANADVGRLAFITNSTLRGTLKAIQAGGSYTTPQPPFLWQGGATPMLDYPVHVTNQIPMSLTKGTGTVLGYIFFGNWADVLIGSWGTLDVLVDPFTGGSAGTVRVIAFNDIDIAVRHPASFVYGYYK